MSSTSKNLGLILTAISDTSKKFLDYRNELSGETNSNMTKIDDAFGPVQDHIVNTNNPHEVSLEQIGAEQSGTAKNLIDAHNISETSHENIVQKIPTQISQLDNDAGYINEETDPTVPSWAKSPNKPMYTASEVGAASKLKVIKVVLEMGKWSDNSQNIVVDGVSSDEDQQLIQPIPFSVDQDEYINSVIICKSQSINSLTFSCEEVPSKDINVYVVVQEVGN